MGIKGSGEGQFTDPLGIALDASGKVYVVDAGNSRVQVFPHLRIVSSTLTRIKYLINRATCPVTEIEQTPSWIFGWCGLSTFNEYE